MVPASRTESSGWEMFVFQVFNQSPCSSRCARTAVFATFMMNKITCVEGGLRLRLDLALSEILTLR